MQTSACPPCARSLSIARQTFRAAVLLTASLCGVTQALAADPPARWVVPSTAGGGSDLATRIVAQTIAPVMHRNIVVDNKPGGATILAAQDVAKARADGATLLTAGQGMLVLNPALYRKLPYDVGRDFTLVTSLVKLPVVLVTNPALPMNTLPEFIAWIKAGQGKATYASVGAGSPHHLSAELMLDRVQASAVHAPYKGTLPALQDVAGGQVDFMMADLSAAVPLIRAGRLRAIALPAEQRSAVLPDVPTFAQAGLPGFTAFAWQGVVVPAGTPAASVDKLNAAITAALKDPAVVRQMQELGLEPMGDTRAGFAEFVERERVKWGALIRAHKIALD
ncbi:Bug family tripartite tricarboxylate transporter substrate binding protein [Cupriavidus sp. 2MCAB6]|uniref:Bug family tripartite tricarboxylate transporter substrate binding protein n=1 Tax=Cupriavidus sp. 2MCAB6 TaxID=3232981 RepID=UPI003F8F24AA